MDSISLENLYYSKDFDDYLLRLSRKNLLAFDDFKQESFLLILNSKNRTITECRKIAKNLAMRMRRKSILEGNYFIFDSEWLEHVGAALIA